MSDPTPPDNSPSNPGDSGDIGSAPGGDLDEVLAKAEALAGELAVELGADEEKPHTTALDALSGVDDSAVPTVDDELNRLDELAAHTAEQIGSATEETKPEETSEVADDGVVPGFMEELTNPPESDESGEAPSPDHESSGEHAGKDTADGDETAAVDTDHADAAPAPPAGDAVPDFMADLTQAPDPSPTTQPSVPTSEPPSQASQPATVSQPKLGVVKSRPPGVIGNIEHPKSEGSTGNADASGEGDGQTEAATTQVARNKLMLKLCALPRGVAQRLSPVALKVADKGVTVLEKVDRPTAWLKVSIKQAAGLLAIATAGTSIIVFLVSLF